MAGKDELLKWCQMGWWEVPLHWEVLWAKMPCWFRGQRRKAIVLWSWRKTIVSQITCRYNQGMRDSISEWTTWQTLKQMASRGTQWVPHPSGTSEKLWYAWAHQNWIIEDRRNVTWFNESRFLLWRLDGRVKILPEQHERTDPSCLVSRIQAPAGGVSRGYLLGKLWAP